MIRRLFQIGFSKQSITLINNLYTNASSCIKWKNQISKSMISIEQGVRQGANKPMYVGEFKSLFSLSYSSMNSSQSRGAEFSVETVVHLELKSVWLTRARCRI
jgi:hypothetical protein